MKNFGKDIEKTYGIRIPVSEFYDYYIETLFKSPHNDGMKEQIGYLKELAETGVDLADIKGRLIFKSVEYLKSIFTEDLNKITDLKNDLSTNNFIPEHGKRYISFDVKEANWTVIKHYLNLHLPDWKTYSQSPDTLNLPKAIAYSKPIRQAILGQVVNPKLYDKMQKCITSKHLKQIQDNIDQKFYKISAVCSEEIILEVIDNQLLEDIKSLEWIVPTKTTCFDIDIVENFGDRVIIKKYLDGSKSLYAVDGKRMYIHFKTLILDEHLDQKDLLFKLEHKIFEYCGTDYKDFKEYNYVKKHIKPIVWNGDFGSINNDIKYMIETSRESFVDYELKINIKIKGNFDIKEYIETYHYEKIKLLIN